MKKLFQKLIHWFNTAGPKRRDQTRDGFYIFENRVVEGQFIQSDYGPGSRQTIYARFGVSIPPIGSIYWLDLRLGKHVLAKDIFNTYDDARQALRAELEQALLRYL